MFLNAFLIQFLLILVTDDHDNSECLHALYWVQLITLSQDQSQSASEQASGATFIHKAEDSGSIPVSVAKSETGKMKVMLKT